MKSLLLQDLNSYPNYSEDISLIKKDNQVIVELHASAINHRDLWIIKGMYPGINQGVILGSDGAGIYNDEAVLINPGLDWGDNEKCQSGQYRVLGMPDHGTFSDRLAISTQYIFPKPEHLSMIEAAALPLAGITAYRALFKKADLQKGDKVFINGIGGGVALFALQFAMAIGCEIYVSSSSELKLQKAIDLGARGGVIYTNKEYINQLSRMSGGIDVVIDSAGGDGFASLMHICNPGARVVFYGGTKGNINGLNPQLIFWKQICIFGTTMGSDQDFKEMISFVNEHKITPIIDKVYGLKDVKKAFDRMNNGIQFGKIVFDHSL